MTKTKQNWLNRGMAVLLAVMMLLSMVPMTAFAAETEATAVTISDENLRKAICAALGKEYIEGVEITDVEIASLTELVAEDAEITDLTGLENAINLKKLDLSGNNLSNAFTARATFIKNFQLQSLQSIDLSYCNLSSVNYLLTPLSSVSGLETVDLSNNELKGVLAIPGVKVTWETLKNLNLSNNNLNGISFSATFTFPELEKIDLSENRVWTDENAGSWYSTAVDVGLDKIDFSNQKTLTELCGVYIKGESDGFDATLVDNQSKVIDLGTTLNSSISFKVQGYGAVQTMSGTLDGASMPVMIAGPETVATAVDNCIFTVELSTGSHSLPLVLTHANGTTDTYTVIVTRNAVPGDESNEESAGIKDPVLQKLVCDALNGLSEYTENPVDYKTHVITKAEMEKLTGRLRNVYDGTVISDLSGMEYAVNLTQLELKGDFTGSVDVSKWVNLTTLNLSGEYTEVVGLSDLENLKSLTLTGNFTSFTGYEELTTLTSITINGNLETSINVSKLTNLTSLSTYTAQDGTLPDISSLSALKTIYFYDCQKAVALPEKITAANFTTLNLNGCSGDIVIPRIESSKTVRVNVNASRDADLIVDISNLEGLTNRVNVALNTDGGALTANSILAKGAANFTGSFIAGNTKSLSFADDFKIENATSMTLKGVSEAFQIPQITAAPSVTSMSIQSVKFSDGKFPVSLNDFTALKSLTLSDTNIVSFDGMDLSRLTNLTKLTLNENTMLKDSLVGTALPASLQELSISESRIKGLAGDWSALTQLKDLNITLNYMNEFPSEAVRALSALAKLQAHGNLYSEIAENTFENTTKMTYLTIGSFLPVVKVETKWQADPNSTTGKALAKLTENSPSAKIVYDIGANPLGIPSGTYSGLTDIKSSLGTVSGEVFSERSLALMVPAGSESVTITPQALLNDTVITVGGKEYKSGDEISIDLYEMITTVTITCQNDYVNDKYYDQETVYTLTITAGEYIEDFRAEEGKVYNIAVSFKKANNSTSMANGYFAQNATVRYKDGQYEIRFVTTQPDYISDMKYTQGGVEKQAEIVGGDGVTTREYRIYADSIEERIPVTPRVIPMNSAYTTCYMVFDLSKAIDITASAGADKADLNAAINKAIEITEKRNVYTSDSYSAMLTALEEAQKVAALTAPLQSVVDNAEAALTAAIDGLVVDESKLANKTDLEAAITEAKAVEKGDRTDTAWNALQEAIADAEAVFNTLEASQSEVDAAKKALNTAVTLFNSSGAASTLDKNNLADGIYSVYVDMVKLNRTEKSMADNAINHTVKLEVIDGEYYITLDFKGITIENRFGYLKNLSYYADGYTYGEYGTVTGTLVPAEVLSTQKDSDGNDVIDQYNDANNLYPDIVKIKLVPQAIADENGYVPLHVFVPIMEAIAEGNGNQDVLMKIDWSTLKKTTADDEDFQPEEPVEQSPAVDYTDADTGVKVNADKGVFEADTVIDVTEITSGEDYNKAAESLSDVGKKFKLYNVAFADGEGNAVAPNGTIRLSFPIASGYDADNLFVYRINADGTKTRVNGTVADGYFTVVTRNAGTYALVEAGSTEADNSNNGITDTNSPQTGDTSNLGLWFALMIASLGAMLVTLKLGFKRKSTIGE